MDTQRISYADVIVHGNGIVEVIVDEGVEVSARDMHELHDYMQGLTPPAHGLFANRKNSYSFTFSAYASFKELVGITAIAEVTHGKLRNRVLKALWPSFARLQFFDTEQEALEWLHTTLQIP